MHENKPWALMSMTVLLLSSAGGNNVVRSDATAPTEQKVVIMGYRVPPGGPGILGTYIQPEKVEDAMNAICSRYVQSGEDGIALNA